MAAKDIVSSHKWSKLKTRATITVVSGTTTYDLPSDFDYYISDTMYPESSLRGINMPANDQMIALSDVENTLIYQGRILGDQIELQNVPSGDIKYMYQSNAPVVDSQSKNNVKKFTYDADEWRLDDELLTRAIFYRYRQALGYADAASAMQDYNSYYRKMIRNDVGSRIIGTPSFTPLKEPITKDSYAGG